MSAMNNRDTYGWMAVALHWLLFILVAGLVASGKYSDSLDEKNFQILGIHKQVGVAVFVLMAFRLLWKLINPSPSSLAMNGVEQILAFIVHWTLYAVVLGQSLTGILMNQFGGRDVAFLGIKLPPLFGDGGMLGAVPAMLGAGGKESAMLLREYHYYGGTAIIVLVVLHVLGALYHHMSGAETLRRMWFGYKPPYAKDLK